VETLLSIENLTVSYKTRRGTACGVNNVSLELEENRTLGLAGESGCGKSTLGRAIMRLVPYPGKIVSGKMILDIDREIQYPGGVISKGPTSLMELSEAEMRALRGEEIAYIFQDPMTSLNPMKTIGDHFVELVKAHYPTTSKEEAIQRAKEILEGLGILPKRVNDYPHQFSGGMRQRVMIGLGLALRPRLLIADEPTTSLDVIVEAQILQQVAELKEKFNLTLLLITHNLGVLAQTADSIAVMYAGRIVEVNDTVSLFEHPQHPYTKALLESVPDVTKPDKRLCCIPGAPPDLLQPISGCPYGDRCTQAMEECKRIEPLLVRSGAGGLVACNQYKGD
jgi:oligopeptide/dipeptide ABC transporter ATP-binding protein